MRIPPYSLKNETGRMVLQTPELTLNQGEVLALTGPSGSGKSLFVKSLFGWSSPQIEPVFSPKNGAYLMVQDPSQGLTPRMSVQAHFREICTRAAMKTQVPRLLGELGFVQPDILDRRVDTFSGGERQRLMLALLLIQEPKILVCDEPAASLDRSAEIQLWQMLLTLRERNQLTLIFITHQLQLVRQFADRVLLMDQGRPAYHGTCEGFFKEPIQPTHKRLIDQFHQTEAQTREEAQTPHRPKEVLTLEKVSLAYGENQVLTDVQWHLYEGQWWWLCGPSGCGKTTLAKIIAGILAPASGRILLEGEPLSQCLQARPKQARLAVQYLFQHGSSAFNPMRKVGPQLREIFEDPSELGQMLDELQLSHLDLEHGPDIFSLGEIQRLNLVRALGRRPRIIIGDELFSALDLNTKTSMINLLDTYQQRHKILIILITHEVEPLALHFGTVRSLSAIAKPHPELIEPVKTDYWFPAV